MGPEAAKEFKESSVIQKGGGVVLPFPGKAQEKVEPVKKETSKEYGERIRRRNKKIAWILLGTVPPITTEAVLETIHDTGHAEIIPWYDSFRDKVVNGVKSLFVKNQEGEIIGTIDTTPATKPPETTSLPAVSETTSSTTAEETAPPTTEAILQTVEYKGSIFTLPEFSEANSKGEILALAGNPYGVEAGTKIGQCLKDVLELNGKMVNSEAFIPPVIEYLQKKIMEENNELKYALPFYPNVKGIKITEIENKNVLNDPQVKDILWDKPKQLAISNIPLGTIIYSPVSTSKLEILNQSTELNTYYDFFIWAKDDIDNNQYNLSFQDQRVDVAIVFINVIGAELVPPNLIEKFTKGAFSGLETEGKIGIPLAKFNKEVNFSDPRIKSDENDKFSLFIYLQMSQWNFNKDKNKDENTGFIQTGSYNLLTEEGILVSTLPPNE